jgi:hypothetical protein
MFNLMNKTLTKILKTLDLKSIFIICLIIVILLMKTCGDGKKIDHGQVTIDGKPYIVVKTQVDTIYKEVVLTQYKPGRTIYVDKPIYINVLPNIDTLEILREYFATYIYKDTLKLNENLGYVSITDTITRNKIKGRLFDAHINKIIIDSTIYVLEPPKRQLYIGGVAGFDKQNFLNFFGPSLAYKPKKDGLYTFGIGLNNNKSISLMGGIYWKIKLKK